MSPAVACSVKMLRRRDARHRASNAEGCNGGIEIRDDAFCSTPAEVRANGIEDRAQMLPQHPIRSRQLEPRNIEQPHRFGVRQQAVADERDDERNCLLGISIVGQSALQVAAQLHPLQPRVGCRPKQVSLTGEVAKQGCFVYIRKLCDFSRRRTFESLPGE